MKSSRSDFRYRSLARYGNSTDRCHKVVVSQGLKAMFDIRCRSFGLIVLFVVSHSGFSCIVRLIGRREEMANPYKPCNGIENEMLTENIHFPFPRAGKRSMV